MSNPRARNSPQSDPAGSFRDHLAADAIPDPLLQSDSFIDTNTNISSNGQTLLKSKRDNQHGAPEAARSSSANGVGSETPVRARRKGSGTATATMDTASWLPPGWLVEDRVRASGATAGTVDKYYIDPASGRRFRSKREVQCYLETGTLQKKRSLENSDADNNSSGKSGQQNKKSGTNAKISKRNFDYFNVPDRIEWLLTKANEDIWTPFVNGKRVPKYDRLKWDFTFASLTEKLS